MPWPTDIRWLQRPISIGIDVVVLTFCRRRCRLRLRHHHLDGSWRMPLNPFQRSAHLNLPSSNGPTVAAAAFCSLAPPPPKTTSSRHQTHQTQSLRSSKTFRPIGVGRHHHPCVSSGALGLAIHHPCVSSAVADTATTTMTMIRLRRYAVVRLRRYAVVRPTALQLREFRRRILKLRESVRRR